MEGVTLTEVTLDVESLAVDIKDLRIDDPEFYNILAALDDEERIDYIRRALKVGAVVLQVMDTTTRVDYVRGEFEAMQREMDSELEKIFSDKGTLVNSMDRFLGKNGELKRALDAHFGEQGSVIYKILNPDDESTPLGKFRKQLQQELDADREGTGFQKLKKTMEDGFEKVMVALGAAEAAEEERDKGTAKGGDFEDNVYVWVDIMARDFEDTVEFVGDISGPLGKVGDVLIHINPRDTGNKQRRIVVEAKKARVTMTGKNSFLKELDKAKENRVAHYAIGAVHESKAPSSCGCFRRFDGEKIVCSVPEDDQSLALEMAYKIARSELVASSLREEVKLDLSQLKAKIGEIERQLDTVKTLKTNLKGAVTSIGKADDGLREMEASIREIAGEILLMIKTGNQS
jgi:hypothetical protein